MKRQLSEYMHLGYRANKGWHGCNAQKALGKFCVDNQDFVEAYSPYNTDIAYDLQGGLEDATAANNMMRIRRERGL